MTWLHLLAGDFAAAAWVVRDARRLGGGGRGAGGDPSSLFSWTDDEDEDDESADDENDDNSGERQGKKKKTPFFSLKKPKHFPCAVSLVLCFMAGPLGITSHLLMRRLWYLLGWAREAKRGVIGSGGGGDNGDDGGDSGGGERGAVVLSTF